MTYKVIDIEGVGESYAQKLTEAGVNTVDQLLERCVTPKGRKELAETTGTPPSPCREPRSKDGRGQQRKAPDSSRAQRYRTSENG